MLQQKFQKQGFQVFVAENGRAGLDIVTREKPSLVITDYNMPLLNGIELATRLKGQPQTASIPVIMFTGKGHRIDVADLAQTNIKHVVPKPFSLKDLQKLVVETV